MIQSAAALRLEEAPIALPSRIFGPEPVDEEIERLGDRSMAVPEGFIISEPGEKTGCCYLVKKGRVLSVGYTDAGDERVWGVYEKGSVFLASEALTGRTPGSYFRASVRSELVEIPTKGLEAAMVADKHIALFMVNSISMELCAAESHMRSLSVDSAIKRVCRCLLEMSDAYGKSEPGGILVDLKVSQQAIADYIGINRVTLVKVIKTIKESGAIAVMNGCYFIKDREKLMEPESFEI